MTPIAVDPSPFYEQRVIILMESAPQSNHYHQVFLNKEQFMSITAFLGKPTTMPTNALPDSINPVLIETDDLHCYDLHSEIKSVNR